jgi:hypothetical protein
MLPVAAVVALQLGQVPFPTPADEGIRIGHDYVADLIAMAPSVPRGERAWNKYLVPYGALRCMPDEVAGMPKPGDARWERAADYCRQNRKWFAQIRAAASMPAMGYPLSTKSDPDALALPPCPDAEPEAPDPPPMAPPRVSELKYQFAGAARSLTRLLWCDAMLAVTEKDGATVGADLRAMMGLSRHAAEHANSMTEGISIAIAEVMFKALRYVLETDPGLLSQTDLNGLSDDLVQYPAGGRIRPSLDFERAMLLDELQRAYADDGKGDGRLTANGIRELDQMSQSKETLEDILNHNLLYAGYFWAHVATRAQTVAEFDARANAPAWKAPLWELDHWPDTPIDRDLQEAKDYRTKYTLLEIIMPNLAAMARVSEATIQRRDAAKVAIALELFRRKNRVFPGSLKELLPALLQVIPPDRFTGKAICYRVVEGRAVVYSCGPDLKDDEGRASSEAGDLRQWRPPRAPRDEDDPPPDGDWVLFELRP